MLKLYAFWAKAKSPLLWMVVPILLYAGWHLYIDHRTYHRVVSWVNAADAQVGGLQKEVKALKQRMGLPADLPLTPEAK
jgi:hypothetical protein